MQKLNVRFARKVNLQIDDIGSKTSESVSTSMIARAAMQIGLNELQKTWTIESRKFLDEKITIQNLKALN